MWNQCLGLVRRFCVKIVIARLRLHFVPSVLGSPSWFGWIEKELPSNRVSWKILVDAIACSGQREVAEESRLASLRQQTTLRTASCGETEGCWRIFIHALYCVHILVRAAQSNHSECCVFFDDLSSTSILLECEGIEILNLQGKNDEDRVSKQTKTGCFSMFQGPNSSRRSLLKDTNRRHTCQRLEAANTTRLDGLSRLWCVT